MVMVTMEHELQKPTSTQEAHGKTLGILPHTVMQAEQAHGEDREEQHLTARHPTAKMLAQMAGIELSEIFPV